MVETEEDIATHDAYFSEPEENYIKAVKEARDGLREWSASGTEMKPANPKSNDDVITRAEFHGAMNLPKSELETFNGDPTNYHIFVNMFDEVVGQAVRDDEVKLTRLMQYTAGKAREAIKYCVHDMK